MAASVLMVTSGLMVANFAQAPDAAATTITVPTGQHVQARMDGHVGWTAASPGGTANAHTNDDYRYGSAANATGSGSIGNSGGSAGTSAVEYSNGYTGWVTSGTTAWTSHGNVSGQGGQLNLSDQSALGFAPANVASFTTGTIFNLGRMAHSNNPVNVANDFFRGDMDIRFMGMTLDYRWEMHETPNWCNGNNCSDDIVRFLNQVTSQTFEHQGLTYTLVVRGFVAPQSANTCAATLPSIGNVINNFRTRENATTYGCLYASVEQVRNVTVKKDVSSPYGTAPARDFTFTRTSTLAGSPWSGANFTLADGGTITGQYNSGEQITISETAQTEPWSFTAVSCVDGQGTSVGTVSGQQVTIAAGTTTENPAAANITCTFTNTYTPRATLTLKKNIVSDGQQGTVALPAHWTLTATGQTPVSQVVTGPGSSPAVTSQTVIAGTYALSEAPNNAATTTGYQPGDWTCTAASAGPGGSPTAVPVSSAGHVTLQHGQNVTCEITNTFRTGALRITKTVSADSDGYTAGVAKPFTAQYTCGTLVGTVVVHPAATNGQAGQYAQVNNVPAGVECEVVELSAPTGTSTDLTNTSWTWNAPVNPVPVTIPYDGVATANIGNSASQQTGTFQVTKVITPRGATPPTGYTGGNNRTFPAQYECTLGGVTVSSGTLNISAGAVSTVTGVPATSDCRIVSETLTAQGGDFADASYSWDGNNVPTTAVTVPANGTASTTVTNYFKRTLVDLTLAKVVTGDGYTGTGKQFTVLYDCGTVTGSVSLAAGGSETVSVPAGVLCQVTEDPLPSADLLAPGYVWETPTYEGLTNGSVVVAAGHSGTVTVTNPNRIGFGQLEVTKAIANHASAVTSGTTFGITVSCDAPAQGAQANYSETFTFSWPDPVTQLTPYLPIGADCTVTETSLPSGSAQLFDSSYTWAAAPAAQNAEVPASTTPTLVTVTNDIERVYGAFGITKNVTNTTSATHGSFSGGFVCTYAPTNTVVSGTWTAPADGGAATLTPGGSSVSVLAGSSCTVTEAAPALPGDDTSYSWTTVLPGATTVAANQTANAVVGNTLNRSTGSFSVSKSVSGGAAGTAFTDGDFTFSYICTPLSGDPISGTLTMKAGGSASPTEEIPLGAGCVVTETGMPAAIDPFTWDGVSFQVNGSSSASPVTFEVGETSVAIVATNAISNKTATVRVNKVVSDPDDGFVNTAQTFPITLICDGESLATKNVAAGGSASWTVDLGAECTATEGTVTATLKDASFAWGAPTYAPASVTASDSDGDYAITVTNPVTRVYGEIGLRKIFNNGGHTDVVATDKEYTGTWTCTYPGATPVTGTWSAQAGQSATLTGDSDRVLLASSCTATENALGAPSSDPSYSWADPVITTITTGSDAAANVIQVTNTLTRQTGALDVTKTITGETAGYAPTNGFAGFSVTAVCSYPGVTGVMERTVSVLPGSAVTLITGVPSGWTCEVSEASPATLTPNQLYDGSFAWGDTSITINGDATNRVSVNTGVTAHVAVANDITRVLGTLEVTKVIATPAAVSPGADFSGAYTCAYEGPNGEVTYNGTWTRTGAGTATLSGDTAIPVGAECSVTEDDASLEDDELVDTSWTWGTPELSAPAVVSSAAQPAALTVTNRAERVFASFDIAKSYTGPEDAFSDPEQTVTGTWSCVYGEVSVASGTWTAPAYGGAATIDGDRSAIPATSECTISENSNSDLVLRDASFAWGPHPAPQQVTLVSGQTPTATVANSVERVTGGFTITKNVNRGEGVSPLVPADTTVYSGTYECTYDGQVSDSLTWSVQAGQTWSSPTDFYVGSECRITGETLSAPVPGDGSYVWGAPILGDTVTIVAPGTKVPAITVVNTLHRNTGSFSVTKAFAGDTSGLPANPEYTFDWVCVAANGDEFPEAGSGQFAIAAGGLWQPTEQIPVGSECTVTERTDLLPTPTDPSYTWSTQIAVTGAEGEADGPSITFTLPEAESAVTTQVTATNTLTRTMGSYAVAKTADPASGSTVKPGDEVTYTITVTPGEAGFVDDVVVTDDLSGVLPHATLDAESVTASQGTVAPVGDTLVWNVGRVGAGDPLTLTYTVTIDPDQWGVEIRNVVTVRGEEPPTDCDPCTTEHMTPSWTISKSADPVDGSVVEPGDVITYTLTARNTSERAPLIGAIAVDDLSGVLDDAALHGELPAGVTVSGTTLTWAVPDLEPGASTTVSYAVIVNADAVGATIRNVVTGGGEIPPTCEEDCETEHTMQAWTIAKTSTPASGSTVQRGDTITYTLTATNTGSAEVAGAIATDNLAGVLAQATLIGTLPSGLTLSGTTLTWAIPTLAVGNEVSVSYSVVVNSDAQAATLRNVVTATGPVPPQNCEPTDPCSTTHIVPPPLAVTGADLPWDLIGAGALMMLFGGLAVVLRHTRRRDEQVA